MARFCSLFLATLLSFSLPLFSAEDGRVKKIVSESSTFGFSLYSALNASSSANLIFSPYSVFSCMSMVYIGARSDTATQMRKALSISLSRGDLPKASQVLSNLLIAHAAEGSYKFDIANGLWLDRDTFVLADYRHTVEEGYQAKVQSLDFSKTEESMSIINEWTANQTHNKIPRLLQGNDIDSTTRVVLTNAVYFKGRWQKQFDPEATVEGDFTIAAGSSPVQVKMMEQATTFPYFENDQMQVLALPFEKKSEKSAFSALILLPKKDAALSDVEAQLTTSAFQKWLTQLESKNVHVKLPKFCLDNRYDLNDPLQKLGIRKAFTPEADFSGIDGMKDLYLTKVVHQTFFALDEVGVTAAAATAASINVTAVPPEYPPIDFTCDHPFLIALVDLNTKLPLFLGKIGDPSIAQCE